jgi:O-acetyl-ADP-ribose deacetylase (regulator of RNase III)
MNCVFMDLNKDFVSHISSMCQDLGFVKCYCDDIQKFPIENTAFICPCNEFGVMNAGIAKIYNEEMFEKIECAVKQKIKSLGIQTALGRFRLPIGSALIITAIPETNSFIIITPIMFTNQNVSNTNNAYYAFMATLCLLKKYNNDTIHRLVCPGLCTGIGGMCPKVSAQQIYQAISDFKNYQNIPIQISHFSDKDVYITEDHNHEQPNYYENLEIKSIDISQIIFDRK